MNIFARIFGALRPAYVIRAYIIGLVFFGLMFGLMLSAETEASMPLAPIVYFILCTLLFPFAKFVWDELRDLVFGDNVIFMNAIFLFMLKWFINGLLWSFAIFVAPFGLLYLWFRTRGASQEAD